MKIEEISPEQAIEIFKNQNVVCIDVREPMEHASQRIPNSILLPLGTITSEQLPPADQYLIYCQKGIRGKKACEKIITDNPDIMLYNLSGGIDAWQRSGLITQTSTNLSWPLRQQSQTFVGIVILLLTAMVLIISSMFIYAIALLGIIFILAGLTGLSGVSKFLAKMPWNQR